MPAAAHSPLARLPRRVKKTLVAGFTHSKRLRRWKLITRYYVRLARKFHAWEAERYARGEDGPRYMPRL